MPEKRIFDRSTILKVGLGTMLGALAVWLALRGVSFQGLAKAIADINPWLVLAGLMIVLLNVAAVSFRWWIMLVRDWDWSEYIVLLDSVYLGQMFNILLPARLGELARIYFVNDRTDTTKSTLLGSLFLEKVLDIIVFGIALISLIAVKTLPEWISDSGKTVVTLTLVSLVVMIVILQWGKRILGLIIPLLQRLPASWGDRVAGMLDRALIGFDSMRSWRRQLAIWGLTFFSLFLSTLTNFVILRAVHLPVSFLAALFVLIVLQVGSAPPSAPGKLGIFHYLVILALSAFNVDKDLALAYAVVLYIVALIPKVLIGAGVVIFSKWRLPALKLGLDEG